MIINPQGLTVTDWCDSMAFILAPLLTPQKLLNPTDWKNWARNVIQAPAIARFRPPNPDEFQAWDQWADRFNQSLEKIL